MHRAFSLYLPNWPVDLLRRRDRLNPSPSSSGPRDEYLLLVHTVRQRPVVAACCERALRAGVAPGMNVADARALIRSDRVRLEPLRAERDAAALESLARWATRFSPIVSADPPDGLLLNITGCSHLFRGEGRLLGKVIKSVQRLGISCRAAIAPTYGAAWALARFGPDPASIVESGAVREALAPLPVHALRLTEDVVQALGEVGIVRVGDLLDLPRSTLPSRFGAGLLLRRDQALGLATESIEPVRPKEPPRAERALDGPTTSHEVLAIVVRGLLESITAALATRCAGAHRLDTIFERPGLDPLTITLSLGRPSREVRHLWSLLRPRMERMQMGDGIDRVEVVVVRLARLRDEQMTRWGLSGEAGEDDGPESRALSELCDTLANRLGAERVLRARLLDTHIPERGYEYIPVTSADERVWSPSPALQEAQDRPSLLLHPPESIRAVAADSCDAAPSHLTWRGDNHAITASVGPERIAEAWWAGASFANAQHTLPRTRNYFKVQNQRGRWLWIYREVESARWFIHGLWA